VQSQRAVMDQVFAEAADDSDLTIDDADQALV
jgi:hypothetical protein